MVTMHSNVLGFRLQVTINLKSELCIEMTTDPLRSGAPGGAWGVAKTKLKDGSPVKH